jgi:hypothetical protein
VEATTEAGDIVGATVDMVDMVDMVITVKVWSSPMLYAFLIVIPIFFTPCFTYGLVHLGLLQYASFWKFQCLDSINNWLNIKLCFFTYVTDNQIHFVFWNIRLYKKNKKNI